MEWATKKINELKELDFIKGQLIKSLTKNFINIIMNGDNIDIVKDNNCYFITISYDGRAVKDRKQIKLSDNLLDDIFL